MGLQQFVLICVFASASLCLAKRSSDNFPAFTSFVVKHGREYLENPQEYSMRQALYQKRLVAVQLHNRNPHRRWSAAINHLSDRTDIELSQLCGLRTVSVSKKGRAAGIVAPHAKGQFLGQVKASVLPENKSWENLVAASTETNQQSCGSCWALAASTVLRANAEINGHNRTFSPQELVSCAPNPHSCGGTGGCKGSTVELAMNWVMSYGLASLEETPYLGDDSGCTKTSLISHEPEHRTLQEMIAEGYHAATSKDSAGVALGLQGWTRLPENEYEPLMRAVAEVGPVAVSVAASEWSSYDEGIFDECKPDTTVNHAVTLLGYGIDKESGDKYWILKNSWGLDWGEKGNIRMLRHEGNVHCGTDYKPEDGTACKGGPATVHVCGMCGILYDSVVPHFKKIA